MTEYKMEYKTNRVNGYSEYLYQVNYRAVPYDRDKKEEFGEAYVFATDIMDVLANISGIVSGMHKVEWIEVEKVSSKEVRRIERTAE